MARSKGSANFSGSLEIQAGAPADARTVVPTKADLTLSGNFPFKYIGLTVSVQEEGKLYMLTGNDPTVLANWKEIGSDGENIQVTVLPAASSEEEGHIYQYIGATSQYYIHGCFYECVGEEDTSEEPPTMYYYWSAIRVMEGALLTDGSVAGQKLTIGSRGTGSEGDGSLSNGMRTVASGMYSHAEGNGTTASGNFDHAEGVSTTASGSGSHAEGDSTEASSGASHAEGSHTTASGYVSHAEGAHTTASGSYSHSEGSYTVAGYENQHVSGQYNENKSTTLFEVGNGTSDNARSNAFEVYSDGHANINGDLYLNGTKAVFPQKSTLPAASATESGNIYQYVGATTANYTNGYFYKCVEDSSTTPSTYSWEAISVQDGGGDSELTADVTSNLSVGAIPNGTTLLAGTTFTEFVQKLLITEIAPTVSFSISKSGDVVYGGSYTETLTVAVSAMGTAKKINTIKWYEGSTLVQTDTIDSTTTGSWTYTMETATTDTTTFKAVVTYTKSNDATEDTTKTASIRFFYNKFYGSVDTLTPSEATVEALTTALGTSKGGTYTFTTTAARIAYAYPSSLGALTSIKDGSGFSLFDSFTRTTETYTQNSTSVSYYLYVLTDPSTVSNYTVVFA